MRITKQPMKYSTLKIALSSLLFTLIGCQTTPNTPVDMKEGLDSAIEDTRILNAPKPLSEVPDLVQQELMQQSMMHAKQGMLSEKRLEISAASVDAKDFFTAIVDGSPYSVAIHPDVTGKITLNLTDVTLTETFDVVQQIYGYEVIKKGSSDMNQLLPFYLTNKMMTRLLLLT